MSTLRIALTQLNAQSSVTACYAGNAHPKAGRAGEQIARAPEELHN